MRPDANGEQQSGGGAGAAQQQDGAQPQSGSTQGTETGASQSGSTGEKTGDDSGKQPEFSDPKAPKQMAVIEDESGPSVHERVAKLEGDVSKFIEEGRQFFESFRNDHREEIEHVRAIAQQAKDKVDAVAAPIEDAVHAAVERMVASTPDGFHTKLVALENRVSHMARQLKANAG